MNFLALLLPIVIGLTWIRLIRPGSNTLEGSTIMIFPLPLLARIRMHLLPSIAAIGIAALLIVDGDLPLWAIAIPVLSTVLLISIPVSYTLTSIGIRLGWTSFRRWTEFAGVKRAPGGARLVGGHRARDMRIWLSGSRGDDEFLHFLRQTVRDAYKGTATVIPFPVYRMTPEPDIIPVDGVAAYTAER
jgi:hypothetical protein